MSLLTQTGMNIGRSVANPLTKTFDRFANILDPERITQVQQRAEAEEYLQENSNNAEGLLKRAAQYEASGNTQLGEVFRRAAVAAREQEARGLLTDAVNPSRSKLERARSMQQAGVVANSPTLVSSAVQQEEAILNEGRQRSLNAMKSRLQQLDEEDLDAYEENMIKAARGMGIDTSQVIGAAAKERARRSGALLNSLEQTNAIKEATSTNLSREIANIPVNSEAYKKIEQKWTKQGFGWVFENDKERRMKLNKLAAESAEATANNRPLTDAEANELYEKTGVKATGVPSTDRKNYIKMQRNMIEESFEKSNDRFLTRQQAEPIVSLVLTNLKREYPDQWNWADDVADVIDDLSVEELEEITQLATTAKADAGGDLEKTTANVQAAVEGWLMSKYPEAVATTQENVQDALDAQERRKAREARRQEAIESLAEDRNISTEEAERLYNKMKLERTGGIPGGMTF